MGDYMKSILDPSFRYTPSTSTDMRKTFARLRREQRVKEPARELFLAMNGIALVGHLPSDLV